MKKFGVAVAALSWVAMGPAVASEDPYWDRLIDMFKDDGGVFYHQCYPSDNHCETGSSIQFPDGSRALIVVMSDTGDNVTSRRVCRVNIFQDVVSCYDVTTSGNVCSMKDPRRGDGSFSVVPCGRTIQDNQAATYIGNAIDRLMAWGKQSPRGGFNSAGPYYKPQSTPASKAPSLGRFYQVRNDLNIRMTPDPNSEILGNIPNGSTIEVRVAGCRNYARGNGAINVWCQASYGEQAGWVNTFFVTRQDTPILSCWINRGSEGC